MENARLLTPEDVQYLWLPLAHSFGKVLLAAQVATGSAAAVDGRVDKIIDNLATVSPTFMAAAPRIFEKVRGRVVTMAEDEGGPKLKIFTWAMGVGREVSRLRLAGKEPGPALKAKHAVADKLVFSKLRARFGGQLRFLVSGSAALSQDVAEFFHAAGILILEGYGLTETSAGTFVNRPENYKLGTVGIPFPETEVRIADDGEVLVRGPGVMKGYHGLSRDVGRGARGRRLAAHRRHRGGRRGRVPAHHRPQEGHDQDLGRQVRRAAGDRGRCSRVRARWPARSSCTATAATTAPPW